jgi:hypothetical protein
MAALLNDLMLEWPNCFRVIWREAEEARRVYEIAIQRPLDLSDSY